MSRDTVLGTGLLLLAGGYYGAAAAIPASDLSDAVGPGGLPKAYAVVLAVLSVLLIVRGVRVTESPFPDVAAKTLARVVGLLAIGVVYVMVVPWVGYPAAIAGLLIGTTYYQGGRVNRQVLTVGLVGAATLWVVFVWVLGIDHPTGVWLEPFIAQP